jgi:SNF2 family DNA or RNA helicase
MLDKEAAFYQRIEQETIVQFDAWLQKKEGEDEDEKDEKDTSSDRKEHQLLSWLSMLRQACSHPLLVTGGRTATSALCNKVAPKTDKCVHCRSPATTQRRETCHHRTCDDCARRTECPLCRLVHDFRRSPSSSKIDRLCELLATRPAGSKTLVFSQWVSQLDLTEFMLRKRMPKMTLFRIDGTVKDRDRVLSEAKACTTTATLLCSLRTCAHGLNMQWADWVIILDQDYNPHMERQAWKRVHRQGQTRPVRIYRLITSTRVDTVLSAMQTKKLQEASEFVEGDAPNVNSKRANMSDVVAIFMSLRTQAALGLDAAARRARATPWGLRAPATPSMLDGFES